MHYRVLVTRIKRTMNSGIFFWFTTKFSTLTSKETYDNQLRELIFWTWPWNLHPTTCTLMVSCRNLVTICRDFVQSSVRSSPTARFWERNCLCGRWLCSIFRFGIGRFTTEEEIDYTVERTVKHVKRLREMRLVQNKNLPFEISVYKVLLLFGNICY